MKIIVKKGLNIPVAGSPQKVYSKNPKPKHISLNLRQFPNIRFKLFCQIEDQVKMGQPLVENKALPGQFFVSPAGGKVVEIRRGEKRRLLDIVIAVEENEQEHTFDPLPPTQCDQSTVIKRLMEGGGFAHIRQRPFNLVANPNHIPRAIFVQAAQTLPFQPSFEKQIEGNENLFKVGIEALSKIAPVHLITEENTPSKGLNSSLPVQKHEVQGPHPAGNLSVAIQKIAPIQRVDDYVWTLDAAGVLSIGGLFHQGRYYNRRILSLAGPGIQEPGYFTGRIGFPLAPLLSQIKPDQHHCFISGDPLTGEKIEEGDFLGFSHFGFSVFPISKKRESFHFLGFGAKKFTATRTYLSHFIKPPKNGYPMTTNQHGEHRAFVDGAIYEKVMPLKIPTMHLVKALLAQNFELAEKLGALEVIPEDFALPQFICPSKVEMMEMVQQGLDSFAHEMGH